MAGSRSARAIWLVSAAYCGLALSFPALAQDATPAEAQADEAEVTVTGTRASLSRAVESKRDASTVIDSISQEELGKFPDRNVADSLGNVPGISVRRTRGAEGQNVSIRGLGQGFSIVTLNDRVLP